MTATTERRIALPEWTARVSLHGEPMRAAHVGAYRAGPLTVLRPSDGCAMYEDAARRLVTVFDGYLVDRSALTAELRCAPGTPPEEIVARAYTRWGPGLFDHLDGCYLAAVCDGVTGRTIVGHDALGRHPVFFSEQTDGFWFSSNVLSLAASGAVIPRPNRISLALVGLRYWPEAGETYFEDVCRLQPGYYLAISAGTVTRHKYWDPLPDDDEAWWPEAEVLEELEPALRRAVARCMQLAPQGVMLSGGIDSVTIAALAMSYARDHQLRPLVAVSGQGTGPPSYEEVMQSRVAQTLGMPHVTSTTAEWRGGRDQIEVSLDVAPELPSPGTIHWVGTYVGFYRRTAAQDLQVLLTGSGGDNWLGVGDAYAADLIAHGRLRALFAFLHSDVRTGGASWRTVTSRRLWAGGVRPLLDSAWARLAPHHKSRYHRARWLSRLPGWLAPDPTLRRELVDRLLQRRTPPLAADGRAPRSYYRHALRSYSNPYLHHEYETAFHVETMCGLRLLSPYHDRRLVTFFNRIAPATLVHGGKYKGLLRPLVAAYLPTLGLENQNKVYPAAEQARELQALRDSMARACAVHSLGALERLGVVDGRHLGAAVRDVARASTAELSVLYGLLSAERWITARTVI